MEKELRDIIISEALITPKTYLFKHPQMFCMRSIFKLRSSMV